jgi:hypothetical protein
MKVVEISNTVADSEDEYIKKKNKEEKAEKKEKEEGILSVLSLSH